MGIHMFLTPGSGTRHSRLELSSHSSVRCVHTAFRSRPHPHPSPHPRRPGWVCTKARQLLYFPGSVLLEQT